jgi:hypothetical protein
MAKALELNADTLAAAQPVPKAAQVATPVGGTKRRKRAAKVEREPLQVRWPASEVKAAKLASIQLDFQTVSDFMLACFHAYMKSGKQS